MLDDIQFDDLMDLLALIPGIPIHLIFQNGLWLYDGVEVII